MNATLANALTSPLSEERAGLLLRLTDGLEPHALQWLSGYTAGLAAQLSPAQRVLQAVPLAETQNDLRLSIIYGSQTGNAKREAEAIANEAQAQGLSVRLLRADAYPVRELANERLLYVVISTQGDGDPPDDAQAFFEFISGRRAPALKELKFAVLGLGDSSYPQFNAIAKKLDARFAELGATRLLNVGQADVDIAAVASSWREQALRSARELLKSTPSISATITPLRAAISSTLYTREKPYLAEVLVNQRITARESEQDVRHLEIALHESLSYEPGDALGVWPRNHPALVDTLLEQLKLNADEVISIGDQTLPLHEWLSSKRELTRLSKTLVQKHAEKNDSTVLNTLLASDDQQAIAEFINQQQLLDLLNAYPGQWQAEALVHALRPLTPRLYSIASSQKTVGDEAHLTVSLLQYQTQYALRRGLASNFLAEREIGTQLPVFIERNERFRLPIDTSRDILMIGPGTGVAPFRGFVQERCEVASTGKNWLIFGARHAQSQFLYQLEWQEALKKGQLHRLDLAFSRDQAERIYVQQRLLENGADVYAWLENGAHLYVCGAVAMGKDVHQALLSIIREHGGKTLEDANDYLSQLQQGSRYAKDVY
jgi:sulfite reductase (NADPH) flavoprotein alpha-component